MNRSRCFAFALLVGSAAIAACSTPGFGDRDASDAHADTASMSDAADTVRADAVDRVDVPAIDAIDVVTDTADVPIGTDGGDTLDARAGCRVDGDCASGRVCCTASGACYDPSCTTCCAGATDAGSDGGIRCAYNTDCPAGQYCAGDACGTAGMCAPIPDTCPAIVDPVCGCDHIDYVNPCRAAAASTRAAYHGMCPGPDAGPGECVDNSGCSASQFCNGIGCGTPGSCIPRPTACDTVLDPVCACDGTTYPNDCVANAAGVRVIARGTCVGDADGGVFDGGTTSSCLDNSMCGRGQFCDGRSCGTEGTCTARPDICPDIFDPVCGCNGLTYSNACEAHVAGTRVATSGACGSATDAGSPDLCLGVLCAIGQACCPATGACYDTRCLACCPAR